MSKSSKNIKSSPQTKNNKPKKVVSEKTDFHFGLIFCLLSISHLFSAFYNNITDCDETFNFWEPTHYLTYQSGFQTWEYSPEYSLRSYTTLLPGMLFGKLFNFFFHGDKVYVFYALRCMIALLCSYCEATFLKGVANVFNTTVAYLASLFFCFSVGQFISSSAYLNSSIAMISLLYSYGQWYMDHPFKSLFVGAMGVILGWPFSGLAYIPVGLSSLYSYGVWKVISWFVLIVLFIAVPDILINYYFYHKWTFPCLNIVLYNVLKVGGGPELYGTEPWTFYYKNLLLNMNVCSVLMFLYPLILLIVLGVALYKKDSKPFKQLQYYIIFFVFLFIFFRQDHKEERFLYQIYPFVYLTAALTLYYVFSFIQSCLKRLHTPALTTIVVNGGLGLVYLVFILLSLSRILAFTHYFHAPLSVYDYLYHQELKASIAEPTEPVNICIGKEWHRYPASYFIPNDEHYHVQYIQSGFTGLLPKQYAHVNGTFVIPTGMNTMNQQEMDRYIDANECDYIIDLHLDNQIEPQYEQWPDFHVVYKENYLDIENSQHLVRSFFIPLQEYQEQLKWLDYMIIRHEKRDVEQNPKDTILLQKEVLYEGHQAYFDEEL